MGPDEVRLVRLVPGSSRLTEATVIEGGVVPMQISSVPNFRPAQQKAPGDRSQGA